jgi:hypothetical protein
MVRQVTSFSLEEHPNDHGWSSRPLHYVRVHCQQPLSLNGGYKKNVAIVTDALQTR